MVDHFKFTVDGRELQAKPGTLLIDACRASGIEVPSFCYYPGLSLQAACRMCLVEIEKAPKLQTACTVPVAEGMIVRTATPQVAEARKSMLELLLANHPLDCPVCDKGGECELQDMVFRYGAGESRFTEEKRHVEEQQWSPVVYFDAPRCILCYRCVRICDEGLGEGALGVLNRGASSEITPNHGDHLDCQECGMCIDICPVGALTSGAYRYKARPWEIQYVSTTCAHCADGCKTTLSVRNNKILRGNNRDHSGVNGEFLCIKGRYAYDYVEHESRLKRPFVRKAGALVEVSWDEAVHTVATRWKQILDRQPAAAQSGFGVIGSNHTSNETNYLLQRFSRSVLRSNNIDHARTADFAGLINTLSSVSPDPLPLAASRELKSASAILLIGGNPTEQHPLLAWNIREAVRLSKTRLYLVHTHNIALLQQAAAVMPAPEGKFSEAIHYLGGDESAGQALLGRTPGGRDNTSSSLAAFRERVRAEADLIIVLGPEITGDALRRAIKFGRSLDGQARFICLGDYSNSRGASDMGLLPHLLPGYLSVSDDSSRRTFDTAWGTAIPSVPGFDLDGMLQQLQEGSLESLYVVGANPLERTNQEDVIGKTFLVVQDLFLNETARVADVVFPAASAYEINGTVTNTCGELQLLRKALELPGARPDIDIICDLARRLGHVNFPMRPDDVLREIVQQVPGYGVSMSTLLSGTATVVGRAAGEPESRRATQMNGQELIRIHGANDNLFTSGTMGKYSKILSSENERRPRLEPSLL